MHSVSLASSITLRYCSLVKGCPNINSFLCSVFKLSYVQVIRTYAVKYYFFSCGCFHVRYVLSQRSSYSSDDSRLSSCRDERRGPRGRKRYRRLRWHQTGNSVLILLKLVSDGLEVLEVQTFGCCLASDPVQLAVRWLTWFKRLWMMLKVLRFCSGVG